MRIRSTLAVLAVSGALVVSAAPAQAVPVPTAPTAATVAAKKSKPGTLARAYLGAPPKGLSWHSGAWTGGWMSAAEATSWGTWRGTPSDVTLTFPEYRTWREIERSTWHIDTYQGFKGTLVYGMPLLPKLSKPSELSKVTAGKRDATFRKVARDLKARGRGNSVVRIGWEANGTWMRYSATRKTAPQYRAAYRRAAQVMRKEAPGLKFSFDINCGTQLRGQKNRLDSLTQLYPGNDVVDMIGCSAYDWDVIGATSERQWRSAVAPKKAVGLADVATFARSKKKGIAISEWGLASTARDGNGDNPFYIRKMRQYFQANADILVLESYFNQPDRKDTASSLWPAAPLNPKAGAEYRKLW